MGIGLQKKMPPLKTTSNKLKTILKNRQKCPSKKKVRYSRPANQYPSLNLSQRQVPKTTEVRSQHRLMRKHRWRTTTKNEPAIRRGSSKKETVEDWETFLCCRKYTFPRVMCKTHRTELRNLHQQWRIHLTVNCTCRASIVV